MSRITKDQRQQVSDYIKERQDSLYFLGASYVYVSDMILNDLGFKPTPAMVSTIAGELSLGWHGSASSLIGAPDDLEPIQWDRMAMFLGRVRGKIKAGCSIDFVRRMLFEDKGIKVGQQAMREGLSAAGISI